MARRKYSRKRKRRSGGAARFLAKIFFLFFFLLLLAAGAVAWLLKTPYGPETETFVQIAPGSSAATIGRQLEAAGVVRSRYLFDLVRFYKRGVLRPGEYRFDHPALPIEVYTRLRRGDVYATFVTIPEGSTLFDIASRLNQAGLAGDSFLGAAASQTSLVADLDPHAKTLEGYLFPDTYQFPRRATGAQICATMVKRFRAVAAQLGMKENLHHVVTIASLVERETAVDADRPLVASVFENRLAKKMPLKTDPAVIYGLQREGLWRGAIYKSDLKLDTPYNTYLHPGLPPGPIANPGVRALKAALAPARTDYLYFVAAGANAEGASRFARTDAEHSQNVAAYREAMKKAGLR
jgi:UPF0755 protein